MMPGKIPKVGALILQEPLFNKGTAFSMAEREKYHLFGLLPCNIESIEEQLLRCWDTYSQKTTPIEKHIYLRALQDCNEVLFYRFLIENLETMLPTVYTPVVGAACERFHHIYNRPRGIFLAYPERKRMGAVLSDVAKMRTIRVIVVTDGERILGLGDQGVGGLGIPIGKLALYTGCGGIDPASTLPIILDVGTNNQERLNDPEYLGWRHERITGAEYDHFVDAFVHSVKKHFPDALLQFEDFAQNHAYPLLERYRDKLCTFNDDIQGTAAVVCAAVLAATRVGGVALKERKIAVFGGGSAGCGISQQLVQAMILQGLSEKEALSRIYLIDRNGLVLENAKGLLPFQRPFARSVSEVQKWNCKSEGIMLYDVIQKVQPSILLGVSGQGGKFTEEIVREMAAYCEHPIIFPLSNPTTKEEAVPSDLLNWTEGRGLIATGSPFDPVIMNGKKYAIAQCNNAYIFPGLGLGIVAGKVRRVTDGMIMAAAIALSELAPAIAQGEGALLPRIVDIRKVSQHIAKAVILQAIREGVQTGVKAASVDESIQSTVWFPDYKEE